MLGIGFTFDDTDNKGIASSLAEMQRLLDSDPRNRKAILPYIGAQEVNTSPTHAHHRYVINFGERSEEECRRRWPDLLAIVEERVKPTRMVDNRSAYRERWWQYAEKRKELYSAIDGLDRVLVTGAAAVMHHMISMVPSRLVYSHKLIVFPFDEMAPFAALQSRAHEIWSTLLGTTFGSADALTYNPTRVFHTFPFPENWETSSALTVAGQQYHDSRAALMVDTNEGITKIYNRFHDVYETDPRVIELRKLHNTMDRAVLDAYGWTDIPAECEFFLDYEIDETIWGRKKKPYRYRWPDPVRDKVLARLLSLNAERASGERQVNLRRSVNTSKSTYVKRRRNT